MSNYKVKVNNEAESKEVQELFFELGYGFEGCKNKTVQTFEYINTFYFFAYDDLDLTVSGDNSVFSLKTNHKEITTPQLKDLVVLKRNSIDDATHEDCKRNVWFVSGDDKYMMQDSAWELRGDAPLLLKPIINPPKEYLRMNNVGEYVLEVTGEREAQEPHAKNWIEVPKGCDYLVSVSGVNSFIKESMIHKVKSNKSFERVLWQRDKEKEIKEYLVPQDNGKYALTKATEKRVSDWVEIPSGAEVARNCSGVIEFYKNNLGMFFSIINNGWESTISPKDVLSKNIVWQRHTKPEELLFVDDEPKASTHGLSKWFKPEQLNAFGESAKKVAGSFSKLSKGISIPYEPKSLNDTYAEIEQVRHNHYFKDVSDVNQIDVYEVLKRFNVTDPCLQHIVKKALCAGQRGHKDFKNDLQDILDTAKRAVEINK